MKNNDNLDWLCHQMERQLKWDFRFLEMAELVAGWSKDPSTKTGAVIVDGRRRVVSVGYNGFPRGMDDDAALYNDRELKYAKIIHCEMNAVLTAGVGVKGCTLYTWPFLSCDRCAVHMIQAGIVRAVAPALQDAGLKERWADQIERTKSWFSEAGIEVVEL